MNAERAYVLELLAGLTEDERRFAEPPEERTRPPRSTCCWACAAPGRGLPARAGAARRGLAPLAGQTPGGLVSRDHPRRPAGCRPPAAGLTPLTSPTAWR